MIIRDEYTIECLKAYLPPEFQPRLVNPFEVDPHELITIAVQSSAETAEGIANCLKFGVEHTADSDSELALQLADTIVAIGERREEGSLVGLGTMARGDTLARAGHLTEAWETLESAGGIYREAGDEVGWARTRIGQLPIGVERGSVFAKTAFVDAEDAKKIFELAGRYDRLLRLYHNWAYAHVLMGLYEEAVTLYQKAVETVSKDQEQQNTELLIAYLYSDIGYAYNNLGQLNTAMQYLNQARTVMLAAKYPSSAAMAEFGMANTHIVRGEYRQALHLLLNSVIPNLVGHFAFRGDSARLAVVDCYLTLNRDQEAYELAQEVLGRCKDDSDRRHAAGLSALLLATAQSRLRRWDEARASLDLAEACFSTYSGLVALTRLRRGMVALREGNLSGARQIAHTAAEQFMDWQQSTNWMDAILLEAEAALMSGDLNGALILSQKAQARARQEKWLPACYRSYLMLGQILEQKGRTHSSVRYYQAALAVLHHMQRSLTVSLRTGFLEDKLLPFHHLMHLYFGQSRVDKAFETLEQLKSQVFQDYLTQRETVQWPETVETQGLLAELRALRDRHQWYMQLRANPPLEEVEAKPWYRADGKADSLEQAILDCEKQMRQLTDQLYLYTSTTTVKSNYDIKLQDIQKKLSGDTILIEFYIDKEQVWCFGITHGAAHVYKSAGSAAEIQQLVVDKWTSNLDFALQAGPDDPRTQALTGKAQRMAEKLGQLLLGPLETQLREKKRVVIVPFGFLHLVPFNILRCANQYLIETHDVVILPSASLLLQTTTAREGGAMVLAHSWDGRLEGSVAEGAMVHRVIGGAFYPEEQAQRGRLDEPPRKVLHISTHGEHRIDRPDFAYVELSDGPAYTDDLLQCDLSYELVTLSACETGRANVTAGDELIGLGRGFLYAGAGALITSLWRVNEAHTYHLMEALYRALCAGESKAGALRRAQRELLSQNANLHPAFWGAFQLIGNAEPLSTANGDD